MNGITAGSLPASELLVLVAAARLRVILRPAGRLVVVIVTTAIMIMTN